MLRLLRCGVVVCVVLFSLDVVRADEAEEQAVAFVVKQGGRVVRDKQGPGRPVVQVFLDNTRVKDGELSALAPLTKLTHLDLTGVNVTDAGMKHLAGLSNLAMLNVSGPDVSDVGVKHLWGLKNLTMLGLGEARITEETMQPLRQALPACYLLGRGSSSVPDELR